MAGEHVHQTIAFYDGPDGALRIKLDDGAAEGRMVVDRIATDEDKKTHSPMFALYQRKKKALAPMEPPAVAQTPEDEAVVALVRGVNAWQETARQHAQNEAFYRGIVQEIGDVFGEAARTADDGSVMQDVLALKVPGLVRMAVAERDSVTEVMKRAVRKAKEWKAKVEGLEQFLSERGLVVPVPQKADGWKITTPMPNGDDDGA